MAFKFKRGIMKYKNNFYIIIEEIINIIQRSTSMSISTAKEVYEFWFNEENEENWFVKNDAFDKEISDRFHDTWEAARHGLLYEWRETLEGAIAEIIVLDQFSRNINRGTNLSYAQDQMALLLSQNLMQHWPEYRKLSDNEITFIYLPWMHSESKEIQKITEKLYLDLGITENIKIMYQHKEIIDEFGRYPYRNDVMGRTSTAEELDFLLNNDLGFTKI